MCHNIWDLQLVSRLVLYSLNGVRNSLWKVSVMLSVGVFYATWVTFYTFVHMHGNMV